MNTYSEIISAIKLVCSSINLQYSDEGDGRITSAVKEKEYLDLLEKGLKDRYPTVKIERPKERYWYDVRINTIPINLKLTTGGTDNAFNKVAILYTISGQEVTKRNMNYNDFFKAIREGEKKSVRNPMTEYHYLVIHKESGKILLKSILDIHTYKSNPCNDLQINWTNEFHHLDYFTPNDRFKEKIQELLKAIQTSVKKAIESMREFADTDLQSNLFT